jgi:hypothetical protein
LAPRVLNTDGSCHLATLASMHFSACISTLPLIDGFIYQSMKTEIPIPIPIASSLHTLRMVLPAPNPPATNKINSTRLRSANRRELESADLTTSHVLIVQRHNSTTYEAFCFISPQRDKSRQKFNLSRFGKEQPEEQHSLVHPIPSQP